MSVWSRAVDAILRAPGLGETVSFLPTGGAPAVSVVALIGARDTSLDAGDYVDIEHDVIEFTFRRIDLPRDPVPRDRVTLGTIEYSAQERGRISSDLVTVSVKAARRS